MPDDTMWDDDENLVRCARCGKQILGSSTRCPECGVHFQGVAEDFYHESELPRAGKPLWVVIVAVILLIMTIGSVLWMW